MDTDKLEDVTAVNAARHKEWLAAKKEYDRGRTNINPRHGQDVDVWSACYCCKFTCNLDPNGGNCPECSKPDADHLEWDPRTGLPLACHCPLCNSGCKVRFASTKRSKIKTDILRGVLLDPNKRSSTSWEKDPIGAINDITTHHVMEGTFQAAMEGCQSFPEARQNAGAFAANSFAHDIHLQSNVAFRNAVQKAFGNKTDRTVAHGLSIDQVRNGVCPPRLAAQLKAQQRKPLPRQWQPRQLAQEPLTSSASDRSHRKYRNNLHGAKSSSRLPGKHGSSLAQRLATYRKGPAEG